VVSVRKVLNTKKISEITKALPNDLNCLVKKVNQRLWKQLIGSKITNTENSCYPLIQTERLASFEIGRHSGKLRK